ncbi:class E sortase [uncultured Pseudokineococcus sp.]|uniref:class E sortase n=1 Tax=uncultured Pseudokineococcus sp. TaxID=1642928 RepID=UPI00260A928C|nr:class E sortase [uncultured Pseudokineococcus sp.]
MAAAVVVVGGTSRGSTPGERPSVPAVVAALLGELLVTAGVLVLLFTAWQLWWTDVVAGREQAVTTATLVDDWRSLADGRPAPPVAAASAVPPALADPAPGAPFALVHVPRFGPDWDPRPVVEGTSVDDLQAGVGHYPGTALPGEVGNVALAGHRNTYGRPFHEIAELRPGDPVVLETAEGWFVYRATTAEVVPPSRVEVVAPVPGDPSAVPVERLLTMTACHPIGSARERYVQHAALDRFVPRAVGAPAELAGGAA